MEMVDCVANCTPDAECPRACIARGNDASKAAAREVLGCQYDQDEDSPEGDCDDVIATCTALGKDPAPPAP